MSCISHSRQTAAFQMLLLSKVGTCKRNISIYSPSRCGISRSISSPSHSNVRLVSSTKKSQKVNQIYGFDEETASSLLSAINELEASPSFKDCHPSNSMELDWFEQYILDEISQPQLLTNANKLREASKKRSIVVPEFSDEQVINSTEKWVQDMIIGLNLCPFAKGFESKRSMHVIQSTGLFVPAEYIDLLAQHLLAEIDVVTKLIMFPNRPVFKDDFQTICQVFQRSAVMEVLISKGLIKMDIFHPDAKSTSFLEGDPRNFVLYSPFPTIQLTRGKEQKKIIKLWERRNRELPKEEGIQKIRPITDENEKTLTKISYKKLEFMMNECRPTSVIICPEQLPFDCK